VGGLVGSNAGSITTSYSTGVVTGSTTLKGLVAVNTGTVTNSYWDTTTSGQSTSAAGTGLTDTQMMNGSNFSFTFYSSSGNWIMAGYPHLTMENTTSITNAVQLQLIAVNLTGSYTLANNIGATATSSWNNGTGFSPIGDFVGNFNGQNFTITNLYINQSSTNDVGLFGMVAGATIQNVGLVNPQITGNIAVGSLIGSINGYTSLVTTINNVYTLGGTVTGSSSVGGLLGANNFPITTLSNFALTNAYNSASVVGNSGSGTNIGGIIGTNSGTGGGSISQAFNSGSVTAPTGASNIGGIVGGGRNTLTNVYNIGTITGGSKVGGIMGSSTNLTLTDAYNAGFIQGSSNVVRSLVVERLRL